jgi:hypothetical protein
MVEGGIVLHTTFELLLRELMALPYWKLPRHFFPEISGSTCKIPAAEVRDQYYNAFRREKREFDRSQP